MPEPRRFSAPLIAALHASKILGVRAGTAPHRFTGVWVVEVKGRVFVRSWNDKPTGWHRAFLDEPRGVIQLTSGREIRVRARRATGARLLDAIEAAYAEKYDTAASLKWVRGFKQPRRRATTTEFVPSR
ncbi:MAG TPA: DUF2255 family protein [Gemmatimonadaceae bacterium]|nr:DUF2255 family protein [Gemmatimonadaceae bacterium]